MRQIPQSALIMNFCAAMQFGHFGLRLRSSNKILQIDVNTQRYKDAHQSAELERGRHHCSLHCVCALSVCARVEGV